MAGGRAKPPRVPDAAATGSGPEGSHARPARPYRAPSAARWRRAALHVYKTRRAGLVESAARCLRRAGCEGLGDPEDLVEDVFVDFLTGKLKPPANGAAGPTRLDAYFIGVIWRRVLRMGRTRHRARALEEAPLAALSDGTSCYARAARLRVRARMNHYLDALPPRLRLVAELRLMQDLSFDAIAHVIDITSDTARQRWNRAVHRLREDLDTYREDGELID